MSYLYAAGAVGVALLLAVLFYYRSEAASAVAERDAAIAGLHVALDANAAQEAALGRLRADAAKSDQIVAQMADDLAAIRQQTDETNDAIGMLKETNADVAAYLRGTVPDDLRKLLNHQAGGRGEAGGH